MSKVLDWGVNCSRIACLFAEADLLPSEKQNKIQEKCLKFYVISVSYLATEPNAFYNSFLQTIQVVSIKNEEMEH